MNSMSFKEVSMTVKDLRYIKTEELIRNAFLSCCSERTIEEIHIKDICARARISRNAFYGHYDSKYSLLEAVYNEVEKRMIDDLNEEIISNLSKDAMYRTSEWCIRSVNKNRSLLKILAKCSETRFRDMVRRVFIDETLHAVFNRTELIEQDQVLKMSRACISDGLTSIIMIWLDEPDSLSEKELCDYLYDITHSAAGYFYKLLDNKEGISRKSGE